MSLQYFLSFFHQYGYLIIFLSAFFESIIFTTYLLPGSIIVLFGGYFVGQKGGSLILLLLFAWAGVFIGDFVNYFFGYILRKFPWEKLIRNKKLVLNMQKKEHTAQTYLRYFGTPVIIYSHLLYFRSIICLVAGSAKMSLKKYLSAIFISSILWSCVYVFTGYFFGRTGQSIKDVGIKLQFLFIGLLMAFLAFKFIQSKLESYMKNSLQKRHKQNK